MNKYQAHFSKRGNKNTICYQFHFTDSMLNWRLKNMVELLPNLMLYIYLTVSSFFLLQDVFINQY